MLDALYTLGEEEMLASHVYLLFECAWCCAPSHRQTSEL